MAYIKLSPANASLKDVLPKLINQLYNINSMNFTAELSVIFNKFIRIGLYGRVQVRGLSDKEPARLAVNNIKTTFNFQEGFRQTYSCNSNSNIKPLDENAIRNIRAQEIIYAHNLDMKREAINKKEMVVMVKNTKTELEYLINNLNMVKDGKINVEIVKQYVVDKMTDVEDSEAIIKFTEALQNNPPVGADHKKSEEYSLKRILYQTDYKTLTYFINNLKSGLNYNKRVSQKDVDHILGIATEENKKIKKEHEKNKEAEKRTKEKIKKESKKKQEKVKKLTEDKNPAQIKRDKSAITTTIGPEEGNKDI